MLGTSSDCKKASILLSSSAVGADLAGLADADAAEAPAPFIMRLDARCQPGDDRATDDDAFEALAFADDGHGHVPFVYEERQDLAQRGSPLNLRGAIAHRGPEFMLVALGQPGDLFGFAETHQAPLAVQNEHVGQTSLPHPPQD